MRISGILSIVFVGLLFAGSYVWAAGGRMLEETVACQDRGYVEKLYVILLGEDKELEFVNAVEASVHSHKCIELRKSQQISISKIEAPNHLELHDLPYKMLQVIKRGSKKKYWIYDIDAVQR